MLRKRTSSNIILIAIVVVLVLLSVVSFVLYQNNTRNILAEKSKADMKKSTDQSIILTNSPVSYTHLLSAASLVPSPVL